MSTTATIEETQCIFCHSPSSDIAITENGFNGVRCAQCNLIYISPRPSDHDVRRLYTEDHVALYADAQLNFDEFNRMEAAETLAIVQKYKRGGSMLELGPGGGSFLTEARGLGYEPYAIELNPIEAEWINRNLEIVCETEPLDPNSFDGKQFDVIYHRDVLSHLSDPIGLFSEINRALKRDGILVFETGNIADVSAKYMKYFSQFSYPDHLFFFGEKSLMMLLQRAGFKLVKIYRKNILPELLLQKLLWQFKDRLKDRSVIDKMKQDKQVNTAAVGMTFKRRLRLWYRYSRHYLVKLGKLLPKTHRPLKLIVVASKA